MKDMRYIVTYKQDGVSYRTDPYDDYDLADTKASVLNLLADDLRITDVKINILA